MNIIYLPISEIKPYEKNPRKNDNAVEGVANSIREFGFRNPIIVDSNNEIVAGHTRYKAAIELGMKEVPCIVADHLTEEQIKAFRLVDNKVAEAAEWDIDLLDSELEEIINIDMSDFGFNDMSELADYPNSEEIESDKEFEKDPKIEVSIQFENVKEWRKYEDELRELVDTFKGVNIKVGGLYENQHSDTNSI